MTTTEKKQRGAKPPRMTQQERLEIRKPSDMSDDICEIFARVEIAVCRAYGLSTDDLSSGSANHHIARARALAADLLRGKTSNTQRAAVWRVSASAIVYAQRLPTLDARVFASTKPAALTHLAEIAAALAAAKPSSYQQEIVFSVRKRAAEVREIIFTSRTGKDVKPAQTLS